MLKLTHFHALDVLLDVMPINFLTEIFVHCSGKKDMRMMQYKYVKDEK